MSGGDWKDMLIAVYNGDIDIVKYHIKNGINPNYQHPELLTTPLIVSLEVENYQIAKYLLNNGADPKLAAGFSNDTPLSVAKKTKNTELIQLVRSRLPKKTSGFGWLWRKFTHPKSSTY